jgi:hypothetical protein
MNNKGKFTTPVYMYYVPTLENVKVIEIDDNEDYKIELTNGEILEGIDDELLCLSLEEAKDMQQLRA